MKIAFLILNHRAPAQLLRLLATLRLQLPDAPIVVQHDRFRENLATSELDPISNAHLLTTDRPTAWGDFSLVDACWRSMTWMTEHVDFDWVVLLSAQDYPIKPLAELGDFLAGTGADALLRAVPISELSSAADRRDRRRRYLYQYGPTTMSLRPEHLSDHLRHGFRRGTGRFVDVLNIIQPCFKVYRLPDGMPYRLGWRARSTPFSENEPCWYGSMWLSLSHRATEFVVASVRDRPDYVDYYRRTIIPDESATATLVCNSPGLRIEQRDLHYMRWTHPKIGHPDVFGIDDLAELAAAPEYFARKFDIAKDAAILDSLDEALAGTCTTPNLAISTKSLADGPIRRGSQAFG